MKGSSKLIAQHRNHQTVRDLLSAYNKNKFFYQDETNKFTRI